MPPELPVPPLPPDPMARLFRYLKQPILLMTLFAGVYLAYSVIPSGTGGLGWLWALMGIAWVALLWFAIDLARRDIAKADRQAAQRLADEAGEPGGSEGDE